MPLHAIRSPRDTPTSRVFRSSASVTVAMNAFFDFPAYFPATVWSIYARNLSDVGVPFPFLQAASATPTRRPVINRMLSDTLQGFLREEKMTPSSSFAERGRHRGH